MKILLIIPLIALGGCVWTSQVSEVTVHKDPSGKVLSVDYTERREQRDAKPWQPFGGYLRQYGPNHQ